MPVKSIKKRVFGKCDCCGSRTLKTTGTVFLDDSETLYIARWTQNQPAHGIAILVLIPSQNSFVSIQYSFDHESFMVVGEDDIDWGLSDNSPRILNRDEVVEKPISKWVFALVDEIWLHDRYLRKFHEKHA